MKNQSLIQVIASTLQALENCQQTGNVEWAKRHADALHAIERNSLPSGSGIDNGTTIDYDRSKPERIVFITAFHHMNEAGMYDGWTDHSIIAEPSFVFGFSLKITGRNRNDIKDYLGQVFHETLSSDRL